MMTSTEVLRHLDDALAPAGNVAMGLKELDETTRGPSPGQVWVLTGVPVQGRTTLLTQLADALSVDHSWPTWLVCLQDSPRAVAARLASERTYEVFWHLARGTAVGSAQRVRRSQLEPLNEAPLSVVARGQLDPLSVSNVLEMDPPAALLVDDAHQVAGAFPERVRSLADEGMFVAITLPRHHVIDSDAFGPFLRHEWADIADVIVEIRQAAWPASDSLRPGEADLSLLKNRWGPCRTIAIGYQPHYSRFVDLS